MKKITPQLIFCFAIGFLLPALSFGQAGTIDLTFNPGTGIDGGVITGGGANTTAIQTDGKIIIGGNFTTYNGIARNRIVRILSNGTLDASFNPGTGFNNTVETVVLSNSKILVGGWFTSFNSTGRSRSASLNDDGTLNTGFISGNAVNPYIKTIAVQLDGKPIIGGSFSGYTFGGPSRKSIARVNTDGTLDLTFNPGTGTSANSEVGQIAFQNTGQIIITGSFTSYNGVARNRIARVNSDGSLDATFNPGTGPNQAITSLIIQDDGKIIICGWFTSYNGTARNRIARLNLDGSIDGTFNPGVGPDKAIESAAIQGNGKIIIGGDFSNYNGIAREGIARILPNGNLDLTFNPGTGVDNLIYTISVQGDGKIIIGGIFNSYNNISRNGIARINGDPVTGVSELAIEGKRISVSPNPSQDYIYIKKSSAKDQETFCILNILGKQVLEGKLTEEKFKVDISTLAKGSYLIWVENSNIKPIKFIKQ